MNTPEIDPGNTYLAALAGAILGLRAIAATTYKDRVANLLFGFLLAVYLGPATIDYLHIASAKVAAGVTFSIGAAGLVVFAAILEGIRQTQFAAIIASWLTRKGS